MSIYQNMRSNITPVPTPVSVRCIGSLLIAAGAVSLGTGWPPAYQALTLAGCYTVATALILLHPYRAAIRRYIEQKTEGRGILRSYTGILIGLFPVWLVQLLLPLFAPLGIGWLIAVFVVMFGWLFLTFPHFDGSRRLAFL